MANRALEFLCTCWKKSWPCEAYHLTLVFRRRIMDFKGEIVAEKKEWGEEGGEEGLEALFTWTLNGDRVEGGVKRRIVLHSKVLFRKRVRGEKKLKRIAKGATSVSEWRLSLPLLGFPPPGKWVWRGDCQHHTDKVTVGHTLLSLPSLCGCCCVLFLFFPSISLPLLLSPLCLHLSPCSLYLVAKAFQAASSSLGILEAQQSPHTYTHIL